MRTFDHESSERYQAGNIDVVRWEQYRLAGELPFEAMWYTVPPGGSTPADQHPEPELSVVVTGRATVETGGVLTEVDTGSAFLLKSCETHAVHNRGTEPLLVFSAYWMPTGEETSGA